MATACSSPYSSKKRFISIIVTVGEKVSPNGESETLSVSPQKLRRRLASGSRRRHFLRTKKTIAASIVTACPIIVASAAPAMPQLATHTSA